MRNTPLIPNQAFSPSCSPTRLIRLCPIIIPTPSAPPTTVCAGERNCRIRGRAGEPAPQHGLQLRHAVGSLCHPIQKYRKYRIRCVICLFFPARPKLLHRRPLVTIFFSRRGRRPVFQTKTSLKICVFMAPEARVPRPSAARGVRPRHIGQAEAANTSPSIDDGDFALGGGMPPGPTRPLIVFKKLGRESRGAQHIATGRRNKDPFSMHTTMVAAQLLWAAMRCT